MSSRSATAIRRSPALDAAAARHRARRRRHARQERLRGRQLHQADAAPGAHPGAAADRRLRADRRGQGAPRPAATACWPSRSSRSSSSGRVKELLGGPLAGAIGAAGRRPIARQRPPPSGLPRRGHRRRPTSRLTSATQRRLRASPARLASNELDAALARLPPALGRTRPRCSMNRRSPAAQPDCRRRRRCRASRSAAQDTPPALARGVRGAARGRARDADASGTGGSGTAVPDRVAPARPSAAARRRLDRVARSRRPSRSRRSPSGRRERDRAIDGAGGSGRRTNLSNRSVECSSVRRPVVRETRRPIPVCQVAESTRSRRLATYQLV